MTWKNILKEEDEDEEEEDYPEQTKHPRYEYDIPEGEEPTEESPTRRIYPDDTFVEDYGMINEAEITNWFTTIEQMFERMLINISVGQNEVTQMDEDGRGFKPMKKVPTKNMKMIKRLGINLATDFFQEGISQWMKDTLKTGPQGEAAEDSETNIDALFRTNEYQKITETLYRAAEKYISTIFDECYDFVRHKYDEAYRYKDDEDTEEIRLDPEKPLPKGFWGGQGGGAWGAIKEEIDEEEDRTINELESDIVAVSESNGQVKATNMGKAIKDKLKEPVIQKEISELARWVTQSFLIKLPVMQGQMELNPKVSNPNEYPVQELSESEMLDPDKQKERRDEFEDKYASEHNSEYTGELNWQSILQKKTGAGLTSSPTFSPAEHHITYDDDEDEE